MKIIVEALQELCNKLDQTLKSKFSLSESQLVLDSLVAQDGTVSATNSNRIVVSVINFWPDRSFRTMLINPANNHLTQVFEEEYDILHAYSMRILITANYNNYGSGLAFLEEIAIFLNKYPILFIPGTNKRHLKITPNQIPDEQLFGLWNALGARMIPHLIYTVAT